jgi:hypothetical protein
MILSLTLLNYFMISYQQPSCETIRSVEITTNDMLVAGMMHNIIFLNVDL